MLHVLISGTKDTSTIQWNMPALQLNPTREAVVVIHIELKGGAVLHVRVKYKYTA
jgi:hypothetical protein